MTRERSLLPSVLAALLTMATLFCLTGYQVTGETAATRMLSRLGAALVEIDRWLPVHQEDLELRARDRPQAEMELNDFPVRVSLPASSFIDADPAVLRAQILDTMGRSLYEQGTAALTGEGDLSIAEPVRWSVSALERDRHSIWQAATALALLLILAACAAVLAAGSSPVPPVAVGAGMAAAVSLLVWGMAQLAGSTFDSPVDREIMLIVRDGAWIGLRNSLAVLLVAGSVILLLATVLGHSLGAGPHRARPDTPFS